jgi:uncharacterized protein YjiS (DUF1127 family)
MDPRLSKAEGLLLPLLPTPRADAAAAVRQEAARARDAAIGAWLRRVFEGVGAVAVAIRTWPERRAAYERLRGYTDRELADIGLTRGDLPRVFEPGFAPEPANDTTDDRKAA